MSPAFILEDVVMSRRWAAEQSAHVSRCFSTTDASSAGNSPSKLTSSKKVTFAQTIYDQGQTNVIIHAGEPLTKEVLQKISGLGLELIQVVDHGLEVRSPKWMWDDRADRYRPIQKGEKGYWLPVEESPALTERLEKVVNIVEAALPNILDLT